MTDLDTSAFQNAVKAARDHLRKAEEELSRVGPPAGDTATATLVKAAERSIDQRAFRERCLPAEFASGAAWYLLLHLFVARHERQDMSIAAATKAAGVRPTTGLRLLDRLESAGLIERSRGKGNAKVVLIVLTDLATERVSQILDRA